MNQAQYKPTFVENIKLDKGGAFLYIFNAKDIENNDAWYVVAITKTNHQKFIKAINEAGLNVNLTDYGTILYSGWGDGPPEDIKQKIKDQFG